MSFKQTLMVSAAGVIAAFSVQPVSAQKSADTLRYAILEPFRAVSNYVYPANKAGPFYRQICG